MLTKGQKGQEAQRGGVDEEVVGQLHARLGGLLAVEQAVLFQCHHQLVLHTHFCSHESGDPLGDVPVREYLPQVPSCLSSLKNQELL